MGPVKRTIQFLVRNKTIHRIGYWVYGHYLSFDHRRRYPSDPAWQSVEPSPVDKYDAGCVQIGEKWYVVGGYIRLTTMNNFVDVFDFKLNKWVEHIAMPPNMPQTHCALATDGNRYIFSVSGQLGPNCSPSVCNSFVYDIVDKEWRDLPPLPEPRYAPTAQLWRGRLHVVGGSLSDRYSVSGDHWSIEIKDGRAVEKNWRREVAIPLAAQDRPSAIVNDAFYVFGGQSGDFIPIPGSPCYECNGDVPEEYFNHTYRLKDPKGQWERLADMPIASSHMSFPAVVGNSVILFGGQIYKDPKTFGLKITDAIQKYDMLANQWTIVGHTPYGIKTAVVAFYNGWFYISTGQRDCGANNPGPGRIVRRTWRVKLKE